MLFLQPKGTPFLVKKWDENEVLSSYRMDNRKIGLKKSCCFLLLILGLATGAQGQNVAVKTNVLYDAALTPNAGIEIGLAPRWTFEADGSYNGWILPDESRWKHAMLQPGVRYWFCDRFSGHFVGVHAHGGLYNFGGFDGKVRFPGWNGDGRYVGTDFRKFADTRYQGWFAGAGVSYGYAWILGDHWNLEAELGVGYAYTRYDRFNCTGCGKKIEEGVPHHYVGPTKAAVSLVYLF